MNTMDRLMELVEDKGLTLFQIAQMSAISYNTLKRTRERGGQLSVDTIEALCVCAGRYHGGVFFHGRQESGVTDHADRTGLVENDP